MKQRLASAWCSCLKTANSLAQQFVGIFTLNLVLKRYFVDNFGETADVQSPLGDAWRGDLLHALLVTDRRSQA
jgi:hypothetical protein